MKLKYKIQHYLAITDGEFKFLLVLSGILLLGTGVKYIQQHRVPDYSQLYAAIDSTLSLVRIDSASVSLSGDSLQPRTTGMSIQEKMVNINTAAADELITLPGIGPAIAARIIDYRRRYGGFTTVDDLTQVRGIGPRTLERIRSRITT